MKLVIQVSLIIIGTLSLALGIIGIVLPLIPTTPFLLLSAACFVRSSNRLYQWLIHNKWFGSYIQNFRAGKGIPLKAKVIGVATLWISIIYSAFFIVPLVFVRIIMMLVAAYFTWFILSQKTLRR
ncbi:YbaN family protein [Halobacillus naozhouensis]|uniref:YbaN family protein n=1 Tax=Halobacillus naozhouensis TaxID=554880 RepID=A0ABY8IXL8_9BACI|nr:YbaN family protein [Halobacillus naozhouensis]WFT74800.1 YbaN family protein [Halobacillus naozhouensis]